MARINPVSRREFLRMAGGGTLALMSGGALATVLSSCSNTDTPEPEHGASPTRVAESQWEPDVELALTATVATSQIHAGKATQVWTYQGEVLSGNPDSLQSLPGSYLGPILHFRTGQRVRIHFNNDLPEPSIIHWHGLHVPHEMDGHPMDVIDPGETYIYEFQIANRAGTYWFHPHPHGRTGPQVYNGLAGLFLISDDEEEAAGLPSGDYDLPLIIQDRSFTADNQFLYLPNGAMDRMMGFLGDQILVNGQPNYGLSVAAQPYRLRLLNGSNSRVYKLGWSDGSPLTVIATDGGLLEQPVQRDYVTLAPAERIELWVDFSQWDVGSELRLQSLPFSGDMMPGRAATPHGSRFDVLTVHVDRQGEPGQALPAQLSTIDRHQLAEADNGRRPRTFALVMQGMAPTINGRQFEMEGVAADEIVRLNTLEAWEFVNQSGAGGGMGMMGGMTMPHPMHVHGLQFQVVDRQVEAGSVTDWQSVSEGYVDEGWKDTVLVMPGERVKILLKFEDFTGLYIYHCHNLEHEDLGMMRNYRVDV
ncbi:MAG: multicopper oxidase domain-containing protein [Anaerolineae bacterium]|nr:multicopper oxidase domain-containing protein [Anaerolineae bacterium]